MTNEDRGFRFLEHMTDAEIEAYGKTFGEAFENAGKAVEDLMVDLVSIRPLEKQHLVLDANDLGALLYEWIESLISLQDSDGLLFSRFKCTVSKILPEARWNLSAEIYGEKFDPKKHEQKTAVKAPTFHDMKIEQEGERVRMRFLVDL
jgi:SHS2 domain-containing protein